MAQPLIVRPDSIAGYAWLNQTQSTVSESDGIVEIVGHKTSGSPAQNIVALHHARPGSSHTMIVKILGAENTDYGVGMGNNHSGFLLDDLTKCIIFPLNVVGTYGVSYFTNTTTFSSTLVAVTNGTMNCGLFNWWKLVVDGSNRTLYRSNNGIFYTQVAQIAASSSITNPGYCGFYINTYDASVTSRVWIQSWQESAP